MLKVFSEDVTLEEAEREIEMAKKALINGIPTPISFTVVKCGESYGVLYEEIEPVTILQKIKQDPDNEMKYIFKVADFVRELHEKEVNPGDMPSIKNRYMDWIDMAGKTLGASRVIGMKDLVNRIDDKHTFLHGDLSLDHVFIVGDELMVMDMASCGYGHPIFDIMSFGVLRLFMPHWLPSNLTIRDTARIHLDLIQFNVEICGDCLSIDILGEKIE